MFGSCLLGNGLFHLVVAGETVSLVGFHKAEEGAEGSGFGHDPFDHAREGLVPTLFPGLQPGVSGLIQGDGLHLFVYTRVGA